MIKRATFRERPGWLFCVLLFLLHFASVKLTLFCAVTPEKVVVVWLPNAVLLAALVRFNGTLAAALMAAVVMQQVGGDTTPYLTLARLWWFGDALGLLIYTPMLLAFTYPPRQKRQRTWLDDAGLALTLLLATAVLFAQGGAIDGFPVTPTLLLPAVAVIVFRFGIRMTTLCVALISLGMAMTMTAHFKPFGDVPVYLETLHAQEFILTLCIVGIGFAVMLNELRMRECDQASRSCPPPPAGGTGSA